MAICSIISMSGSRVFTKELAGTTASKRMLTGAGEEACGLASTQLRWGQQFQPRNPLC